MKKPPRKPRLDFNQIAKSIVDRATAEPKPPEKTPPKAKTKRSK